MSPIVQGGVHATDPPPLARRRQIQHSVPSPIEVEPPVVAGPWFPAEDVPSTGIAAGHRGQAACTMIGTPAIQEADPRKAVGPAMTATNATIVRATCGPETPGMIGTAEEAAMRLGRNRQTGVPCPETQHRHRHRRHLLLLLHPPLGPSRRDSHRHPTYSLCPRGNPRLVPDLRQRSGLQCYPSC